jgi:hypothetical protein
MLKVKIHCLCLGVLLATAMGKLPMLADTPWHFQAALNVPKAGLVETVLPAGLFYGMNGIADNSFIDLVLVGPDGQNRSFELFWKEDNEPRQLDLEPGRIYLDKAMGLIWETSLPDNFIMETVRIDLADPEYMGKVDIQVRVGQRWHWLTRNAALYKKGEQSATAIQVKAGVYDQMRLCFKGYDQSLKETALPVQSVRVLGRNLAKDFVAQWTQLNFSDERIGNERVLSALLPGSGLAIQTLVLKTEAQFQGRWRLGYEMVQGGVPEFQELFAGEVATVQGMETDLEIKVNCSWPGRFLILKLDQGDKYLGHIKEFKLQARLPRLVFWADKEGVYRAQAGLGNKALIKGKPGDARRQAGQDLVFSEIIENPLWRPQNLLEQLGIGGGPFNEKGYRWKARVMIPVPGYYRLVLDPAAVFEANFQALRLVKDGLQVPYFKGSSEIRAVKLPVLASYDQATNSSMWTVRLPRSSSPWEYLSLESQGVFERRVVLEIPRREQGGWGSWKELNWKNTGLGPVVLQVGLHALPVDAEKIRVRMSHGDNRPIDLNGSNVFYQAPTLLFIAPKAGEYTLFGGHSDMGEAKYDLALLQAHLRGKIPQASKMEKWTSLTASSSGVKIRALFEGRNWGLYAVLGLVTLILVLLIVRLFPKKEKE